ncbi:RGS domain-containing serine/threonine-protein kinase A [Leucoagaricus sp. SymC.cos]|nr:RGS domain-containing serine/threonine-protein kinase A [Leucoagaricus sp. SymC.cos]
MNTPPPPSTPCLVMKGKIPAPEDLEKQGYPNMTSLVKREGDSIYSLHTGGHADIFAGHLIEDPSFKVAIKVLRLNKTDDPKLITQTRTYLNREAVVWHKLKHENILPFLGLANDLGRFESCPAMISPYCERGTISDYLRSIQPTPEIRVRLIAGVAAGLEYLHSKDIVHGDIKPNNILIGNMGQPLLCDFGRSKILALHGFTTKPAGTIRYQAPESFNLETSDKRMDVCGFGLTSFEVMKGKIPAPEDLEKQGYPNMTSLVKREGDSIYSLHTGGHADIFAGHLIEDPSFKVAIKVLRLNKTDDPKLITQTRTYLNREAVVWHKLKHENILPFLGLANDLGRFESCPAMISPYCERGTISDYLRSIQPTPEIRVRLIAGVAAGLEYLHSKDIVHGDIKPNNILIGNMGQPLLCDFGRSKILALHGFTTKPAGTIRYQAPESFNLETSDKRMDVCGFGLTSFEILSSKRPYDEIGNDNILLRQIILFALQPTLPSPLPPQTEPFWTVLEHCWCPTPENRPDMPTVMRQITSQCQNSTVDASNPLPTSPRNPLPQS